MTWLDVAVLLALAALFLYLLDRVLLPGKPSNAPHPAGRLPLIGDTWSTFRVRHELDRPRKWHELLRDMGPTFQSRLLLSPTMIFTANADNVRHMLVDNFDNYKRFLPQSNQLVGYRYGRHLFGNGIFMADNEAWSFQRKLAVPMFHKKHLDDMVSDFVSHGQTVLRVLQDHARSHTVLNVEKLFMKFTLDTFGTIAFGQSFDSLTSDSHPFSHNFDFAQKMLMYFFSDISYRWLYPHDYFKSIEALNSYVYATLAERRKEDWSQKSDLLSKFLSVRDADGRPLPDEWLRDIVLNFVIAGRDTTGLLLTWTFYELSCHPDVKAKVRKELVEVLQGAAPDAQTITQLPYLDIVIKEVLRLHPSVPHTGRFALKDDVLPDGTVVPAGSMVRYLQYFLHRSPEYWDKPDEFYPERWLESGVIKHKYQYAPFHAGPMRCLGEFMAAKEAKTLIAMILPTFDLNLDKSRSVEEFFGVVMPSYEGVYMYVAELKS